MDRLSIRLLGPFQVSLDGHPVTGFVSDKARALLAYLAVEAERPHRRESLAGLLWPDYPEQDARTSLRTALANVRKRIGDREANPPFLQISHQTIQFSLASDIWIDVVALTGLLPTGDYPQQPDLVTVTQWEKSVSLSEGQFLEGFSIADSPPFEEWALVERERLERLVLEVLDGLVEWHEGQGQIGRALKYARRQVDLDLLHESAHRQLMRLLALSGQRTAALAQYETCRQVLSEELDVEPDEKTTQLYELLKAGKRVIPITGGSHSETPSDGRQRREPMLDRLTRALTGGETAAQRAMQNRQTMLQLVRNTWVQGILEQSLHGMAMIELGLEERADAVERPWDIVVQVPGQPRRQLPRGTKIVDIFDETNQSLLILGEPGSGKTTMLLELARDTIARAQQDPTRLIPVVFNLCSWAEKSLPIAEWLVEELNTKYRIPKKIAHSWVENDDLMLLLDGLDEVKAGSRDDCVRALNAFLREHLVPVVVCSRIADYEVLATKLHLHSAVLLQPLTLEEVHGYLQDAGAELQAVRTTMEQDSTLREMVQTPLLLSVMILAYYSLAVEELGSLDSREARRKHLLDAYTQRMFERRGADQPYQPEQTINWLAWLARKMSEHSQTIFFIEGLQPDWLPSRTRWRARLFAPLIAGLMGGLAGGLTVGLVLWPDSIEPVERFEWSWKRAGGGLVGGLALGLLGGLAFGLLGGLVTGLNSAVLTLGLMLGLQLALAAGPVVGLLSGVTYGRIHAKTDPNQGIRQSAKNSILGGLVAGLVLALAIGLIGGLIGGLVGRVYGELEYGLISGLVLGLLGGLVVGMFAGLLVGLFGAGGMPVIRHLALRYLLWRGGHVPWRYSRFLDYASERIFLRKVGGGYIFVHRLFQKYFASQYQARS